MSQTTLKNIPRQILTLLLMATVAGTALLLPGLLPLPPRSVSFSQSTTELEAYDFVEITAQVSAPHALNPFTDAAIRGTFETTRRKQAMASGRILRCRGWKRLPDPFHAVRPR